MHFNLGKLSAGLAGILALSLGTGCTREPAGDGHEGHDHGTHAGHGHEEHGGHTENKDGVEMCGEHGVPEAACAVCMPDKAAGLGAGESMQLRLPSENSAGIVGISTAKPVMGSIADQLECVAELSFDQNKLAQIAAPANGLIHSVEVDLGSQVTEGQVVARLWSAPIAEVVAKAVLAHQALERERKLSQVKASSEQVLQQAEADHRSACQQARSFGFDEAQIEALGKNPDEPAYLELRAPFAGEIVERSAIRGALAEAGRSLFTVADSSVMWAMIQVPETALHHLKKGQLVELESSALPGKRFEGTLTWISLTVDERTRMVRARAEFPNPEGQLRNRMFAKAHIHLRDEAKALIVPSAAIQTIEGKPFVFVQKGKDLFDARAVRLGARDKDRQQVLEGVTADEELVVNHAFAMKSAMLMSRLGAGCADD